MDRISVKDRNKYRCSLLKSFLFKDSEESLERIINDEALEWVSFEKGETIYTYDSFKKSLGIILKGKVSVRKNRSENVLLNTLGAGEAFGGAVLFTEGESFIACLRAEEKSAMLFISEEKMKEYMELYPAVNMNYVRYLAESLVFLNKRLDIFAAGSAEDRVRKCLGNNAVKDEEGRCMAEVRSFSKMAEYLAIGRASLYRILEELESKGIIKRDGKIIYIIKEI